MVQHRHDAPKPGAVAASTLAVVVLALARAAAAQEQGEAESVEAEALCRAGRAQEDTARQYAGRDPLRALTSLQAAMELYQRVALSGHELACVTADEQAQHAALRDALARQVADSLQVSREERRRMAVATLTLAMAGPGTFFSFGLALQLGPTQVAAVQHVAASSGCPVGDPEEARRRWVGLEVVSWSLISLGLACFVIGEIAYFICSAHPDMCRLPRPGHRRREAP